MELLRCGLPTQATFGIGTTDPQTILHLKSGGSPSLRIQDSDGTDQYATINHNNGSNQYIARNNTSNGQHIWYGQTATSSFNERMRIDSTGNVGIGTTSPDAKLEVAGGSTGMLLSNLGDSSAYDAVRMTYSGYNSGTPEFILEPKTAPGSGTVNSYFRFQTTPNGGAAGTGNVANVTVDGKVGIGTQTPSSKLSIDSVQQDALSINSSDGDGPYAVWKRQNGNLGFVGNANALSLSGNTNFGVRATNDLVFAAGGSAERMRITSAGNVGIGVTSPILGKLQVGGIIHVNRSASNGTSANPIFENILQSGLNLTNISSVQLGNSFGSDHGTFLRFQVNSTAAASTPLNILTLKPTGGVTLGTYTGNKPNRHSYIPIRYRRFR